VLTFGSILELWVVCPKRQRALTTLVICKTRCGTSVTDELTGCVGIHPYTWTVSMGDQSKDVHNQTLGRLLGLYILIVVCTRHSTSNAIVMAIECHSNVRIRRHSHTPDPTICALSICALSTCHTKLHTPIAHAYSVIHTSTPTISALSACD